MCGSKSCGKFVGWSDGKLYGVIYVCVSVCICVCMCVRVAVNRVVNSRAGLMVSQWLCTYRERYVGCHFIDI